MEQAVTSPGLVEPGIPSGGFIKEKQAGEFALEPARLFAAPGAPMEGLIQLVAESFARHGIECPTVEPKTVESSPPTEAPVPAILAEHNYRKSKEANLAP